MKGFIKYRHSFSIAIFQFSVSALPVHHLQHIVPAHLSSQQGMEFFQSSCGMGAVPMGLPWVSLRFTEFLLAMYTIKEAAEKINLPASIIRYYGKQGLLPFVERSESGYRSFSEADMGMLNWNQMPTKTLRLSGVTKRAAPLFCWGCR